jgi:Ca-activated chloride channel family protein
MSIADWLQSSRIRRTLAASAVVLATGGLVLFRAPTSSIAGPLGVHASATRATFAGPGLHGSVGLSHGAVLAGGDRDVYAEVRLSADPAARSADRAPFALAIALDTSGSMEGEKISQAKRAVLELVRDMRDDDQIAVVRYSTDASVVQPLARVGDVRETLTTQVRQIEAEGGTAIPRGMHAALDALQEAGRGRVRRVVLVSDGLDSSRLESERIAEHSFDRGITISSLGIGLDFDEAYMGAVAREGHGNFAFVKDGAALSAFLERELNQTASTTIEGAVVQLKLPRGMQFVSASGADARVVDDGAVELRFGSLFARDERRAIVHLTARLDPGEIARVSATADWTQVLPSGASPFVPAHVDVQSLAVRGAVDSATVEESRDGVVLADATSVIASERELEAANAYARGDVHRARELIDQNVAQLHAARAVAPVAAAPALDKQLQAYSETKKSFDAAPSSGAGRAAAKRAFQHDWENLARTAY